MKTLTKRKKLEETKDKKPIDAKNFLGTVSVNVDNKELSDKEFRLFIRRTLPSVEFSEGPRIKRPFRFRSKNVRLRRPSVNVATLIKNKFLPSGAILQLHDASGNVLKYKAIADIKYGQKIYLPDFNIVLHPTNLASTCFQDAQCMPEGQLVGANYWYWHYGNKSESLFDMWIRYLRSTEHH